MSKAFVSGNRKIYFERSNAEFASTALADVGEEVVLLGECNKVIFQVTNTGQALTPARAVRLSRMMQFDRWPEEIHGCQG